jgi:tRNA(Ile)-lysidine synthase
VAAAEGSLDVPRLRALHPALARRVIVAWLHGQEAETEAVDFDAVDRVLALVRSAARSGRADVGGGRHAARRGERLRLERTSSPAASAPPAAPVRIRVPGITDAPALGVRLAVRRSRGFRRLPAGAPGALPARCWIDGAIPPDAAWVLRAAAPGDRVRLLGAPGRRKLSDILIDAKVPAELRRRIPVLAIGDTIAWVPGLRIAEGFQAAPAPARSWEIRADCLGNP